MKMKLFSNKLAKVIMLGLAITIVGGGAAVALAAQHGKQPKSEVDKSLPAGDTSRGADNFYKSDKVDVKKVTFHNSYNMKVAGNLFVPKNLDKSKKHSAIIVGHPMGAVKEQSANLYAQKMADK